MEEMVKCRDCGFFGVRNRSTRKIEEAEASIRTEGRIPTDTRTGTKLLYESTPVCVAGAADFRIEMEELSESHNSGPGTRLVKCCGKKRACGKFVRWVVGMSPKDHVQMELLAEEKRKNQEWLERGELEGREWLEKQDARTRRFNSQLRRNDRRFQKRIAAQSRSVALICALIGIFAALIGSVGGASIVYWFGTPRNFQVAPDFGGEQDRSVARQPVSE